MWLSDLLELNIFQRNPGAWRMDDFHFILGEVMSADDVADKRCNRCKWILPEHASVTLHLRFHRAKHLAVDDQLVFGKTLCQAFRYQFHHIIVIAQIFEVTLAVLKPMPLRD